jgi:hypothetical protein
VTRPLGRLVWRRGVIVGVPLAYAVLLLFHPIPSSGPALHAIGRTLGAWQVVHVAQLALIGAMGGVLMLLVDGLAGRAATVTRACAVVFVLVYGAYESWTGIATGSLATTAHALPAVDQAAATTLVQAHWESPLLGNGSIGAILGSVAWLAATTAAAVALRHAGAPTRAVVALIASGVLFAPTHVPPFGPTAMLLCAMAGLWAHPVRRTLDRLIQPPA